MDWKEKNEAVKKITTKTKSIEIQAPENKLITIRGTESRLYMYLTIGKETVKLDYITNEALSQALNDYEMKPEEPEEVAMKVMAK